MTKVRLGASLLVLACAWPGCGGRAVLDPGREAEPDASGGAAAQAGGQVNAPLGGAGRSSSASGSATATAGADASPGGLGPGPCQTERVLTRAPAVLQFLVDTSLSMKTALTAELSRWNATRQALTKNFELLASPTLAGLVFYPNVQLSSGPHPGDSWCLLRYAAAPIAPLGDAQRRSISAALAAKEPLGATPTHDAYLYALSQLETVERFGNRYVILLTDSAPSYGLDCAGAGNMPVDTGPLVEAVAVARARGVATFIIGLGNPETSGWMSRLASAGGTGTPNCSDRGPSFCHYQVVGGAIDPLARLEDALLEVSERARSCVFEIAPSETPAAKALVYESGSGSRRPLRLQATLAACGEGVVYSTDGSTVELCPTLCETLTSDPGARLLLSSCR